MKSYALKYFLYENNFTWRTFFFLQSELFILSRNFNSMLISAEVWKNNDLDEEWNKPCLYAQTQEIVIEMSEVIFEVQKINGK